MVQSKKQASKLLHLIIYRSLVQKGNIVMAKEVKVEDNKMKALESAIAQIEKQYGKGSVMKLGENLHLNVESVPSGSLGLDLALGVGGIQKGRVIEI